MNAGLLNELDYTLPGSLGLNQGYIEFDITTGGQPAAGIIVGAWQDNGNSDFQAVTMSDENGHVWLDLEGLQAGSVTLTVSHHRARPEQTVLSVGSQSVDPALMGWSLPNDVAIPGLLDMPFSFTFDNAGGGTLTNVVATLELDPAYGTIISTALQPG
jgi:hypothetical protein